LKRLHTVQFIRKNRDVWNGKTILIKPNTDLKDQYLDMIKDYIDNGRVFKSEELEDNGNIIRKEFLNA